uniref:DEAD/DEAH-box helicase domain-containing protein n=1 Tax=Lactuca sativa TaxID=4236 RepID=A0A9R1WGQ3_LACSA|nr:hypothetical protein LSAT_V11C200057710 [Lactuca sativa]
MIEDSSKESMNTKRQILPNNEYSVNGRAFKEVINKDSTRQLQAKKDSIYKFFVFVLGMLSRVDPKLIAPQALCICPTRELAIQFNDVVEYGSVAEMGKHTSIISELAIPTDKANYIPISKRAHVTSQVVIGTPSTINKGITAKN